MAVDVFDVFGQQQTENDPGSNGPGGGQRMQGMKTFIAVAIAVTALGGLAFGAWTIVHGLISSDTRTCSTADLQDQTAMSNWLGEQLEVGRGGTAVDVAGTGCIEATAGQPVGVTAHVVDATELRGIRTALAAAGCKLTPAKGVPASCKITSGGVAATVKVTAAPDDDPIGDFIVRMERVESAKT